ncbi:suppressor of fused domain protein [Botrimarina mediterranea]|uniref:Suppressor of fused protein (SUFU) n=1 Tax=Botrimarina mediterranea TaxID=2528022 RepID=A0A518K2L7_9BACT|nr:suppressor of fused domain protein [Botrimarina mediterranea]QDV72041.1 Suppressor of fused protein (SUFU) [Botrimarina mediterranea]QDV76582.1 Suppressor of fused protein (SUFU) [Planctomycetes bacterium K2D]
MNYCDHLRVHYEQQWLNDAIVRSWEYGPKEQLGSEFCVLEFQPNQSRDMWTYATCCMSQSTDVAPVEIHLFSGIQTSDHIELLTAIAHYHRTGKCLELGHVVNFGRPWIPGSECNHGVLSLPYLDGPSLEESATPFSINPVRFLWLIPITAAEATYASQQGLRALEDRLEDNQFNYLDPQRQSVV